MHHVFFLPPARVLVGGLLALAGASVLAQGVPPTGRVEQDTRPLPQPFRRDGLRIDAPRFPDQVPAGAQSARFTLGEVQVVGNRAIPAAQLARIWAKDVGQSISLADAFRYAAAVSSAYRQAGFILSQALVPVQDISTQGPAVLRIEVLEGHVDAVTVTGLSGAHAAGVVRLLTPVQAERPLRLDTLERKLLLMGELPGLSAQANLKAGQSPAASGLEVVASRTPREYSLAMHNRSSPSQGRTRFEASADFRGGLTGFDHHNLRWVSSGDKKLNLLAYSSDYPLGVNGLKLQLGASVSRSSPETAVTNVDTDSNNLSLGLSYPVLRSRSSNLALRAGFNGYNNSAVLPSGVELSADSIRVLRFGLTADHADRFNGLSLVDIEASKGMARWGASQAGDALLNGAVPDFSKLTFYVARLQGLGGEWSMLLAATAQQSSDQLPTAEQLGLGGDTFVRAFNPSEAIGEKGSAAKLELRYNFGAGNFASTLYAYYDTGRVTRRQTTGGETQTRLQATGLGVRVSGPRRTKGYLELAKPRQVVASEGNDKVRAFAGLGIDF